MGEIMNIKPFPIDFTAGITPFFQVDDSKRIRFSMSDFQQNPGTLKQVFYHMFDSDENLACLFISGYETADGIRRERLGLGKIVTITNWKNHKGWNDDLDAYIIYTQVNSLRVSEIYRYFLKLMRGHMPLYICFYNEEYLVYVNNDVLDILSAESKITLLKKRFDELYDKFHAQ